MKTLEINNLLKKSPHRQIFEEFILRIKYVNEELEIKGLKKIISHVKRECEEWEKHDQIPHEFLNSKNTSKKFYDELLYFLKFDETNSTNTVANHFNNLTYQFKNASNKIYSSQSIEVQKMIVLFKKNEDIFKGYYYINKGENINQFNKNILTGALLALDGKNTDEINFILNKLPALREDDLRKSTNEILLDYLQEFDTKTEDKITDFNDFFEKGQIKLEKLEGELKQIKETLENKIIGEWYTDAVNKVNSLEKTYNEKLSLEVPAKFWQNRAVDLKRKNRTYIGLLIGAIVVSLITIYKILINTPEEILLNWFSTNPSAAIRWSLIFLTLLSIFIFIFRTISRAIFSTMHLTRDCEERYLLTTFYISLLKENKIDISERGMIIQSLFSRAETGLLKDDGTPSMPIENISKLIQSK
jgi:hypothetical protein